MLQPRASGGIWQPRSKSWLPSMRTTSVGSRWVEYCGWENSWQGEECLLRSLEFVLTAQVGVPPWSGGPACRDVLHSISGRG